MHIDQRAGLEAPRGELAVPGLDHRAAPETDGREAAWLQGLGEQHPAVPIDQRHVDREAHPQSVHVAARPQPERPIDAVALQQSVPAASVGVSQLERSDAATIHDQFRHGASVRRERRTT